MYIIIIMSGFGAGRRSKRVRKPFPGWSTDSDSAFIDVETRGQTGNSLVLSQTSHVLLKLHTTVHYF